MTAQLREWLMERMADGQIIEFPDETDHPRWYTIASSSRDFDELVRIAGFSIGNVLDPDGGGRAETALEAIESAIDDADSEV